MVKKRKIIICENLLTESQIKQEKYNLIELVCRFKGDILSVITFLAQRKLIPNNRKCIVCDMHMSLIKSNDRCDGYVWSCVPVCRKKCSIRKDSIFQDSRLPLDKLIYLMYFWCNKKLQNDICYELNLDKNTVSEWCLFFRDLCFDEILYNQPLIGGLDGVSDPIDVEVDESYFFKRKYNRGRVGVGQWVFGGVERHSGKCFLVPVESRDTDTLLDIIKDKIRSGSRIISDMWAAYQALYSEVDYSHDEINHSLNFISPEDPSVHTQTIENTWMHVKRDLRNKFGVRKEYLEGYLIEFCFRRNFTPPEVNFFNIFIINIINNFN